MRVYAKTLRLRLENTCLPKTHKPDYFSNKTEDNLGTHLLLQMNTLNIKRFWLWSDEWGTGLILLVEISSHVSVASMAEKDAAKCTCTVPARTRRTITQWSERGNRHLLGQNTLRMRGWGEWVQKWHFWGNRANFILVFKENFKGLHAHSLQSQSVHALPWIFMRKKNSPFEQIQSNPFLSVIKNLK